MQASSLFGKSAVPLLHQHTLEPSLFVHPASLLYTAVNFRPHNTGCTWPGWAAPKSKLRRLHKLPYTEDSTAKLPGRWAKSLTTKFKERN